MSSGYLVLYIAIYVKKLRPLFSLRTRMRGHAKKMWQKEKRILA